MSIRDKWLFEEFKTSMFKEYSKHYPKNGDSWKDYQTDYLFSLLRKAVGKHSYEELIRNHSHFIDVANLALFCYFRFQEVYTTPKGT